MVKIIINNKNEVEAYTPYNGSFVKKAKGIKGKWDGKCWVFNIDEIDLVKKALLEVYGENGIDEVEKVNVIFDLEKFEEVENVVLYDDVVAFGRTLCIRKGRDRSVSCGDDVYIYDGSFSSTGGSVKNPRLGDVSGVKLLVKNIPLSKYNDFNEHYKGICEIQEKKATNIQKKSVTLDDVLSIIHFVLEDEFKFNSLDKMRSALEIILEKSNDNFTIDEIKKDLM